MARRNLKYQFLQAINNSFKENMDKHSDKANGIMILEHNKNSGFNSEYLLLDENRERLHEFAINNVLKKLNRKIGTAQKSNHKIRKTCISYLISSGQLTNEEIRAFAGHKDFATTEKYYEFPTNSMDKRANAYEKALSYTKKCNQL